MELLSFEFLLRVIGAFAVLIAVLIAGKLIKRGHAKRLKEGKIGRLIIRGLGRTGIYLIAIGLILWILGLPSLWPQFELAYPLIAKLVQVIVLWIVVIWFVRTFSNVFEEIREKRIKKISLTASMLIQQGFRYIIYVVTILWTLYIFELIGAIQGLLVAAGFAGIVVGFAAKDVFSNFLAGISLLLDRPFKIGDWIHLKGKDLVGYVKKMTLRSTTIIAPDNTPINLPNSMVASDAIVNYSTHRLRRFFLEVGISYESDVAKAIKVIRETLEKDPATAKEGIKGQGYFAPIEIVVTEFAESSVNIQAKVFIDTTLTGGHFQTKSRMLANIKEALTKAGVEIPYPRRVIISKK